jgi:hypothetical protein
MISVTTSPESQILARVIAPENPDFTADGARSILRLRFPESDIVRMNELAAKAREGLLSEIEEEELHGFRVAGAILDLLHSKARLSLKQTLPVFTARKGKSSGCTTRESTIGRTTSSGMAQS